MIDEGLLAAYERNVRYKAWDRARECVEMLYADDRWSAYSVVKRFREVLTEEAKKREKLDEVLRCLKLSYLLTAKDVFDDYCLYLEWDRPGRNRFYLPRRKQLLPIVEALQDLADDKLDLLTISTPPGVGKTTLAIFYLTWLGGKNPDDPMLCGSHAMSFLEGVYREILRIVGKESEYLWHDVFPDVKVVSTNAAELRIDIGKQKRFETFEFTSLGSGNAGKVRAKQLLYCDDLISGIEEAMNKVQLEKRWVQYTTDLRQRKMGRCKELHIATRWSLHDPIGKLQLEYDKDPRARFLSFPALDLNDQSNFDYPYGLGFSTEMYHQQRDIMDDASWRALYMNEPVEREGLLYDRKELRRYYELPDHAPDGIIAVCDTKERGPDYCCMPVAFKYGDDYYIEHILVDNGAPEVVEARLVNDIMQYNIQAARFESNLSGGRIAEKIQKEIKEKGSRCKITTKYTTATKETKIILSSPWVKQHCLFKDDRSIQNDKEYRRALDFLCGYTMAGKNKNDDVPDAFAQLADYADSLVSHTVQIVRRWF